MLQRCIRYSQHHCLPFSFAATPSCSFNTSIPKSASGDQSVTNDDDVKQPDKPHPRHSTIVLLSGGIQSAVLLGYWAYWSHASPILPLYIHLGHKAARHEEAAAVALCDHYDLKNKLLVLNAGMLADELHAGSNRFQNADSGENPFQQVQHYHNHVHHPHHKGLGNSTVAHRNLLLLSLASAAAAECGASDVALGLSKDDVDHHVYSTSSNPFLKHAASLMEVLDPPLQLTVPLAQMTRAQIMDLGQKIGVPWHLTYSCTEGLQQHCGACSQCESRRAGFAQTGLHTHDVQYTTG